jgi:hypothetical protein
MEGDSTASIPTPPKHVTPNKDDTMTTARSNKKETKSIKKKLFSKLPDFPHKITSNLQDVIKRTIDVISDDTFATTCKELDSALEDYTTVREHLLASCGKPSQIPTKEQMCQLRNKVHAFSEQIMTLHFSTMRFFRSIEYLNERIRDLEKLGQSEHDSGDDED